MQQSPREIIATAAQVVLVLVVACNSADSHEDTGTPCNDQCDCAQGERCLDNECGPRQEGGSPGYCCDLPSCPVGFRCTHQDSTHGVCPGTITCSSVCDCDQGFVCEALDLPDTKYCFVFDNNGIPPPYPVHFCCDKAGCPSNEDCEHTDGTAGTCP